MTNNCFPSNKEELWNEHSGASMKYADMFVDFNRKLKPFIKCGGGHSIFQTRDLTKHLAIYVHLIKKRNNISS